MTAADVSWPFARRARRSTAVESVKASSSAVKRPLVEGYDMTLSSATGVGRRHADGMELVSRDTFSAAFSCHMVEMS